MPRGKRIKLAKGIYRDNLGSAIVATVKGRRIEQRWPHLSLHDLKAKRERLIYDLVQKIPQRGTLKADIEAYLKSLPPGKMHENRTRECAAWTSLTALPRHAITPQIVTAALAKMKPVASSQKKALTALRAVWRFHDGPDAPTPVDHIPRPKEVRQVRGVPQSVVTMILRKLNPSKTRARLKVLARTGLPHKQIAQIEPHHLDLERRELTVTPRRKGRGVPARTLPLTKKAVRAFKEFQRVNAFGPFSHHSMHRIFQEAVRAAKASWKGRWPASEHLRPYDLRHAFGAETYRRTKDVRATGELLLHADWTMAARYAESAVTDTAIAARDALDMPRIRATKRLQTPPDRSRTPQQKTAGKRGTREGKQPRS